MKRVFPSGFLTVLAIACLHAQVGRAAVVNVPNSNFEVPGNSGSITGILGPITQQLGTGPWSASSSGVIGLLGPNLSVDPGLAGGDDGVATLTGLASINVLGLLTNGGEFFQVLSGVPLQPNTTYRLSADVTTPLALSLSVLANSGMGIGVGTVLAPDLFKTTTASVGVSLVSAGASGRLSIEFTTPGTGLGGDTRLRLFAGDYQGIASISVVPTVTFDNVLFEIVPEPSSAALLLVGCVGLIRRRR